MASEKVDITVLVVDDDPTTLSVVERILKSWEYKVVTVKNAYDALQTLRQFVGIFDLVITDLHMPGMNGFELQKQVKEEFQLPVIVMSADSRKSVMSQSLESGAAFYMVKPICPDDFKNIWQYAVAARKVKPVVEEPRSEEGESLGEKINFQDGTSSDAAVSVNEHKKGKRIGKRKVPSMNKENQCEEDPAAPKKAKLVWTSALHSRFLMAIREIGLDRAVPKRILDIMNVPGLTRENIASHLQKYRIFLKKVAEGEIEGISERVLRSRFAAGLPSSLIKDIQMRIARLRVPVQQHLKILAQPSGNGRSISAINTSNPSRTHLYPHGASLSRTSVPQLRSEQLSNFLQRGLNGQYQQAAEANSLSQIRLGQSNLGGNLVKNFQQSTLGHYPNSIHQANRPYNSALRFPRYGNMGYGLVTSANGLIGGLNNGAPRNYNYGSLGNRSFNYPSRNGNLQGACGCSNFPWGSTHYPSRNYAGIQLNGKLLQTGSDQARLNSVRVPADIGNDNRIGFMTGTSIANFPLTSMGDGNSGLLRGCSASAARVESGSELPPLALINNPTQAESVSGLSPLPKQSDCLGNAGEDQHHTSNTMSDGEANQLENNLTDLFLMLDDMHLLNETDENPEGTSEILNPYSPSSHHVEQSFEQQPQGASDVIFPASESSTKVSKELPNCYDENPNQLQGNDEFMNSETVGTYLEDNASLESNPDTYQDWDLDFLRGLFNNE